MIFFLFLSIYFFNQLLITILPKAIKIIKNKNKQYFYWHKIFLFFFIINKYFNIKIAKN